MKQVVSINLQKVFALFNNNNLRQQLQGAFVNFDNNAKLYCLDVRNIGKNGRSRDYKHSPLSLIQGNNRGVFIIFDEIQKTVFCVAGSEGQDFYPSKAKGASGNSGVVRYINEQNPRIKNFIKSPKFPSNLTYEQYINKHSILFLCLTPALGTQSNFDSNIEQLKVDLGKILTVLNLKPLI